MAAWVAPLIGAAGGIASSIIGQKSANQANSLEAYRNRIWQEKMSNTAYQRSTKDLEKAGLNRILALGSPASTGSGAQATHKSTTETAAPMMANLGMQLAQIENIQANTNLTEAKTSVIKPASEVGSSIGSGIESFKKRANDGSRFGFPKLMEGMKSSAKDTMKDFKEEIEEIKDSLANSIKGKNGFRREGQTIELKDGTRYRMENGRLIKLSRGK